MGEAFDKLSSNCLQIIYIEFIELTLYTKAWVFQKWSGIVEILVYKS